MYLTAAHVPLLIPGIESTTLLAWLPSVTMIAGILVLGLIMAASFNRRERQLRALTARIASDLEEARSLRTQLDEAHAAASSMMESAERLLARIDERIADLDMASLRMNLARSAPARAGSVAPPSESARHAMQHVSVAPADRMSLTPVLTSIATAMAPTPAPRAGATKADWTCVEVKPSVDQFKQRVYALADSGQPAITIARDLDEQVGEVELVLALRAK